MMSSTSGSEVNDKDLCPIFQSLTMNNAIRLDGGPSAAIFWDNLHLNPLVGASKFYYGTARSVAYPLLSYKMIDLGCVEYLSLYPLIVRAIRKLNNFTCSPHLLMV